VHTPLARSGRLVVLGHHTQLVLGREHAPTRLVGTRPVTRGNDDIVIFSAFTTGWSDRRDVKRERPFVFLARSPADKAMRHARDRLRHVTDRRRGLRPEAIVEEMIGVTI
jgi:hypothetical protein